jgi:hypothetical protein
MKLLEKDVETWQKRGIMTEEDVVGSCLAVGEIRSPSLHNTVVVSHFGNDE